MAGLPGVPSFLNPVDVPESVKKQAGSNAALSREDFFELLITQLTTQDPLAPMDNDRMLDQIATLQGLETNERLVTGIDSLVASMQGATLTQSASFIGKIVTATVQEQVLDGDGLPVFDQNGNPVTNAAPIEGLASGVSVNNGKTYITLEVPILDSDGNAIYSPDGLLITKQVSVDPTTITSISDPLIATSATGSEENP